MAGTTLAVAQAQLDALNAAYTNLVAGTIQAYTMPDGRSVTFASHDILLKAITTLEFKVQRLSRGGLDVKRVVFQC